MPRSSRQYLRLATRRLATALSFAALAACGSDPAAPECTVTAVALSPSTTSLVVGGTSTLVATVTATNCTTTPAPAWSTSDGNVASVSGGGVVTAVAPGSATITAAAGGRSAQSTITVTPVPVASVTATVRSATLPVGDTMTAAATVRDAAGNALTRSVAWSSTAPTVASVDAASGRITAVTPGTTTITATSEGRSGTVTLTVLARVASVTVSFSAAPRVIGETANATAIVREASGAVLAGRVVRWSSAAPAIATVDSLTGVITAVGAGRATIRATVEGVLGAADLLVLPAAESQRFAFAWSDSVNSAIGVPYRPRANWRHNATGGEITVTRTAVGRYVVTFERLGKLGFLDDKRETVLVSAYGSNGRYCTAPAFTDAGGADLRVEVACVALDGTDANSQFTVAVIGSNTLSGSHAFTLNADINGGLDSLFTYATAAGPSSVVRTGLGRYTVDFPISALARSSVIVTPASFDRYCFMQIWNEFTGAASPRCVNANGSADADARFTMLMSSAGRADKRWGFVWSNNAASAIGVPYTPDGGYRAQSNGETTTITRVQEGRYQVRFPGLGVVTNRETVFVSSYGAAAVAPCQVEGWLPEGDVLLVTVSCRAFGTNLLTDQRFSMLVLE